MYAASLSKPRVAIVRKISGTSICSSVQLFIEQFCLAGLCHREYDSTYPRELRGIIRPDEFRQSIENINNAKGDRTWICSSILVFIFSLFIGVIFLAVAGILGALVHRSLLVLLVVGIFIIFFSICVFTYYISAKEDQSSSRMRAAVAEESKKYSNRSPTPCCWSLVEMRTTGFIADREENNVSFDLNVRLLFVQVFFTHLSILFFSC